MPHSTWSVVSHCLLVNVSYAHAQVADLYAPSAVLLPTLSNKVRDTREEIMDYFVKFLAGKPTGKIDEYEVSRKEC